MKFTFQQYAIAYAVMASLTWHWHWADPCPPDGPYRSNDKCGTVFDGFMLGMIKGIFWPMDLVHQGFVLVRSETPDAK